MKYLPLASFVLSVIALIAVWVLLENINVLMKNQSQLGSSILSTASSDTLETFRTNVNTSLSSLQNDKVSTTTAYTWTQAQSILGAVSIGATATTTISTSGTLGVASSSPLGKLGIGTTGATSTISGGYFCAYFKDEAGRGIWVRLATSGNTVFASSTSSCNQ